MVFSKSRDLKIMTSSVLANSLENNSLFKNKYYFGDHSPPKYGHLTLRI